MRQILTKAQFAAFVPKVIEIVRTAQGLGQKWSEMFLIGRAWIVQKRNL